MTVSQPDLGTGPQSVDRALQVLELLASWGSAGVTELADELGVHKSTAFRLLGALEARELVEQASERGKYHLGFGLVRLARRVNVQLELSEQARPVTEKLALRLGESINVAVLRETFAVNVVQSRAQASVVSHNWIGQLTPLHATSSGKVLLAYLDQPRRNELLGGAMDRLTAHTSTDPAALGAELDQVVRQGYATTFGELELGLNAVAVPVRGDDGMVVAALSVSGPAYRLSEERVHEIVPEVIAAGEELSRRLGYWGEAA